jgi:hypothetical protein
MQIAMLKIKMPFIAFALTIAPQVSAQTGNPSGNYTVPLKNLTFENVLTVLDRLTNWAFTLLLGVAVIFIILAAFKYLTARGEAKEISTAHKQVIYAAIAIAVAMASKGAVVIVRQLLGQ